MLPRAVKLILVTRNHAARYIRQNASTWPGQAPQVVNPEITIGSAGLTRVSHGIYMMLPGGFQLDGSAPLRKGAKFAFEMATGLVLVGIYVSFIVLGVLAARLAGDNTVMATTDTCQAYFMDVLPEVQNASHRAVGIGAPPHDFAAQSESVEYVRRCYRESNITDGCNQFVQRKVPYSIYNSTSCPWPGMCYHGDLNSSYTMDTGPLSARVLGINTKRQYEFIRTTTCSPLNTSQTYIVTAVRQENDTHRGYAYLYGKSSRKVTFANLTWSTFIKHDYNYNEGMSPSYDLASVNFSSSNFIVFVLINFVALTQPADHLVDMSP